MRAVLRIPRPTLAVLALLLLSAAACRHTAAPRSGAWERVDLWTTPAQIDVYPFGRRSFRPVARIISFLGAAEVRDMSKVPPQQLIAFPRRTAGQIRALEQSVGSRLAWRLRIPQDAYASFIPLGAEKPCACTYRMGIRGADGKLQELYRVEAGALGPFAEATAEVDLAPWTGQTIDLLFQLDGPTGLTPGSPLPTALWGSPALYGRQPLPPRPRPAKPNVLVIGIDTLRADALGAWGRKPSLTPSIDRLAGESDVWRNTWSTFNVTNPSFVSIFTGLYGKNHGIYDLQTPLPRAQTTLATLLARAGYDTLAVISARHLGDHNSGLGQGFSEVTEPSEHFAGELAVDMTMDWIAARPPSNRPFFAWVHLFDPHTPHTPPEPYASGLLPAAPAGLGMVPAWVVFRPPGPRPFTEPVLAGNKDLYDGEVAYVDRQVGRLLDHLASRGQLDDTLVALVADHGENLGDHGFFFRHVGLYDSTTHVPMMIRWPGKEHSGHRFDGLVQTIDLFPTILGAVGVAAPPRDGQDLRQLAAEGKEGRRAVFAEHAGKLGLMVRTRTHKYILSQGNARFIPDGAYLYDLQADPGETTSLAGKGLPVERELDRLLQRWLADRRPAPRTLPQGLSQEEQQRLRSLGYQ